VTLAIKIVMIKKLHLLIIILVFSQGCNMKKETALLPKASGNSAEMIIVMDSAQWRGQLGDLVRATFQAEIGTLPRQEPMFKINRVDPRKMNNVLKSVRNLIFVMTLDSKTPSSKTLKSYFTKSSIDRIRSNDNLFLYTAADEFARGQSVMYLFGKDEATLYNNITKSQGQLQTHFNQVENKRLYSGLYKANEMTGFTKVLEDEHQCSMRIPFGYRMVLGEPGFVWFRQINDESDKDIFITYKDYISESAFKQENIIQFRDSVAQNQLFEDPDNENSYIKTETAVPYIPVVSKEISFNNKFGVETRGLWKTNNLSMGGPFIGFSVVDEELNRLYYIEGFLYSPGKPQREFMRELEVILNTFKVSSEFSTTK